MNKADARREKNKLWMRKYMANDENRANANRRKNARYHGLRSDWIKENGPCRACGSNQNLEIDHIDERTKEFEIATLFLAPRSEKLKIELAKCQVLCRPCHRKKTTATSQSNLKHGKTRRLYELGCRCDLCVNFNRTYYREYARRRFGHQPRQSIQGLCE